MKTTIEVKGYQIVIEETENEISVTAIKDDETMEEFTLNLGEESEGSGEEKSDDNDIKSFDENMYLSYERKKEIQPIYLHNCIKLVGVTFGYPNSCNPIIEKFDLLIKAHTSIAFVGTTGAGKTTIADIILGLLRPQDGQIFIDDVELTDENLFRWQKNLGYIPQDIYLQDDTVANNIAFGVMDKDIDMKKVEYAAEVGNIHNFINQELSNGYNTVIGERGIRLSGGQRQRIGIARALYNNPQVLVLDEATSALDGTTEQAVFAAIENIAKTRTLIIIAHRLTTVKKCDVIYMLDNGKIVACGKYDELMAIMFNLEQWLEIYDFALGLQWERVKSIIIKGRGN